MAKLSSQEKMQMLQLQSKHEPRIDNEAGIERMVGDGPVDVVPVLKDRWETNLESEEKTCAARKEIGRGW